MGYRGGSISRSESFPRSHRGSRSLSRLDSRWSVRSRTHLSRLIQDSQEFGILNTVQVSGTKNRGLAPQKITPMLGVRHVSYGPRVSWWSFFCHTPVISGRSARSLAVLARSHSRWWNTGTVFKPGGVQMTTAKEEMVDIISRQPDAISIQPRYYRETCSMIERWMVFAVRKGGAKSGSQYCPRSRIRCYDF